MSGIKNIPAEPNLRESIRALAVQAGAEMEYGRPPRWEDLDARGRAILEQLSLPADYLGYAMVSLNNAFWSAQFAAVPPSRRLFLLPHCINDEAICPGTYDSVGLNCAGCGACLLSGLKERAEALGYQVIIAEGTPAVILKVLEGSADAVLGVACLDSLEKSYSRIADLGIPHMAVPLLGNGCVRTQADPEQILKVLELAGPPCERQTRSYLPLLRETVRYFESEPLRDLLSPHLARPAAGTPEVFMATEREALDFLAEGGKRLRPFITIAAYAVATHGTRAMEPGFDCAAGVPVAVRRLAVAIEAMHKASLVHDDIEDEDDYRDGRRTLHRKCGLAPAINIGDWLIGLGYRLIAGETAALGAECVVAILNQLSAAHLDLCRGQGGELLWRSPTLRPLDALHIYSLKTAPAFEAALHAGLRAAGAAIDPDRLRRFCTYLGEGFQVQDDLDDWRSDGADHVILRREALAARPTILRAFAIESGGAAALAELESAAALDANGTADGAALIARVGELYETYGAFAKAEALVDRLRGRAVEIAQGMETAELRELLGFLVRIVLPQRMAAPPGHGGKH